MNYFFGLEPLMTQEIEFFFNLNHLVLIFIIVAAILALYFGLHSKTKKARKNTLLALGLTFLALEAGRVAWLAANQAYAGLPLDFDFWVSIYPFSYCGTMSLTAGFTLIITALKKDSRSFVMQIFYNILFGLGLLGGLITFSAPGIFDPQFPLLHFRNFQTFAVHLLLIFAPLYLIKIGKLEVRLGNVWMAAAGFLGTASILMTASQITGTNRGWTLYVEEMIEYVGVYIPFPWHLLGIFLALFMVPLILYIIFGRKPVDKVVCGVHVPTVTCGLVLATVLICLIPLTFPQIPVENVLGLLCLLPLVVIAGSIVVARRIYEKRCAPKTKKA